MTPTEHAELAKNYFENGYNCAQAVVCAFEDVTGLPADQMRRLASGFGGGIGRLREVCGAFSGAVTVLGFMYGNYTSGDDQAKKALYARIQALSEAFSRENGALLCRDLLGLTGPSEPTSAPRTPEYYQKRPCAEIVYNAAKLLGAYLEENAE